MKHPLSLKVYISMPTTWEKKTGKRKTYPPLRRDISVDVAVIGGGITGILNAYMLTRSGKRVALVEANKLYANATLFTTAFITKIIDSPIEQISDLFGKDAAKIVWDSGRRAIDEIEKIVAQEHIDCEFMRCPNYQFASTKKQFDELKKEFQMYKKLGIKTTLYENESTLPFPNFGYLETPDQAKFHPILFLSALTSAAVKQGATIFEHTEATSINGDGPVVIETPKGTITANDVIIATYKPLTDKNTQFKKGMYKSYVYEVNLPTDVFKEGLYEDLSNPYYYFRIDHTGKHDRMIIGGEDHKDIFGNSLEKKSFQGLLKFIEKILAGVKYKVVTKWVGPILEPSDGLPLIGSIKPHQYVATAFSGNGMTYSAISAMLICDLIEGKKTPWEKVYDPKRLLWRPKRLSVKAGDYIEEFFGGAVKNILR
jgi:glycine/D-amino acid oxidase-like deaminating enzyme